MATLSLQRGSSSNLSALAKKDGQLIVTTDTKKIYLDNGTTRLPLSNSSYCHYSTTTDSNGMSGKYYKINITSTASWMLAFTVRLYHSYRFYDITISGYNYGTSHWYTPNATLSSASTTEPITVTFGYDADWKLWVCIPATAYTGLDIFNVTNGFTQIDLYNAFSVTLVDAIPNTIQSSQLIYRSWNRGEDVTAYSAAQLATARTFQIADNDGTNKGPTVSFNGTANVIINLPSTIKASLAGTASGNLPHFFLKNSSDISSYIGLAPKNATSGWYHVNNADTTTLPTSNFGSVIIENDTGTPYQIFFPDNSLYLYKRWSASGVWNAWQKMSAGYADSAGSCSGNAATATKLATARTISLTGAVTGSGSFDGSGNLSIDTSYAVSFEPTQRADNKTGYRLIGTSGTGPWNNRREIWLVASRHTGCGLLSFIWGHNTNDTTAANAYGQIVYIGPKTGGAIFYKDAFQIYYNETNATFYLFWKCYDYNSTRIMKLLTSSGSWTLANGADMDSIDTSTYGTLICQTTPAWLDGESITGAIWN